MSNAIISRAIDLYFAAFGPNAMQPNAKLSFVTKNGSVVLMNTNPGFLAIVTARGTVMDRVGGQRIEGGAA